MKKILFLVPILSFAMLVQGQRPTMQATIRRGSTPHTVDIYAKPSITFSQKDEQVNFAFALPATILPPPSIGLSGVTSNDLGPVTGITGLRPNFLFINLGTPQREVLVSTETINAVQYYIFTFIFSGTAQNNHDWNGGVEQKIFSISFDGCTANCSTSIKLVSLPNGGSTQQAVWYFQDNPLGDITNYALSFYGNEQTLPLQNGGSLAALSLLELPIDLPVKLLSFTATANACNVYLSWSVSDEINFDFYAVERSIDGIEFKEARKINTTASNNTVTKLYSYTDNSAPSGTVFYRLRLVDKDGKFSYSTMSKINLPCPGRNNILVYPTLSTGVVNVKLPAGFENAKIRVINAVGAEVTKDESKSFYRTISLKKFANGSYMLQVINEGKVTDNVKVVLQH